jgi:chromosomal replication initiator protein
MACTPRVWGDALRRLQEEIPDFAYDAWIAPLAVKIVDDRVTLGCPTSFHRDRVRIHFAEQLELCLVAALAAERTPLRAAIGQAGTSAAPTSIVQPEAGISETSPKRPVTSAARIAPTEEARAATPDTVDPSSPSDITINARHFSSGTDSPTLHSVPPTRRVRTETSRRNREPRAGHEAGPAATRATPTGPRSGAPADASLPVQGELPFSFESFIVGPCNALAREAALALARERQRSLNQVYLGGESGMGKTHLARATAAEARRHGFAGVPNGPGNSRGVLYTSADQFTSEFVSAMRNGRSEEFKRRYRGPIGLLVVEDVQLFSGRAKTQLELFHTMQHVLDTGGRVLLTGDRPPSALSGLDSRMRAQMSAGFVAELEAPDALVRRHILRAKAAAGGVRLPQDCLDLLVESTAGSVRDIESVLIQVVTTSSLLGRTIDLDLTRDAIALKSTADPRIAPRTIAVREIVRIVSAFFGKRPEALASRSRRRDVLVPRQLAMYLAHRYSDASLGEIGRALGRDHPSVRNAIQRIERQVLENAPVRYQVEALSERIDQTLKQQAEDAGA